MQKRVFVTTAYSGENEYYKCIEMLYAQKDVELTHFQIENVGVLEAMQIMYTEWNAAKSKHDLYIQLDADMVLLHDDAFSLIFRQFEKYKDSNYLQLPVRDFLTAAPIFGINCYKPSVEFPIPQNRHFPDRESKGKVHAPNSSLHEHISPVADHCANPSTHQAFHFGWHRTLRKQFDVIERVQKAYDKLGDDKRLMTLFGSHCAKKYVSEGGNRQDVDYTHDSFKKAYLENVKHYPEFKAKHVK